MLDTDPVMVVLFSLALLTGLVVVYVVLAVVVAPIEVVVLASAGVSV